MYEVFGKVNLVVSFKVSESDVEKFRYDSTYAFDTNLAQMKGINLHSAMGNYVAALEVHDEDLCWDEVVELAEDIIDDIGKVEYNYGDNLELGYEVARLKRENSSLRREINQVNEDNDYLKCENNRLENQESRLKEFIGASVIVHMSKILRLNE